MILINLFDYCPDYFSELVVVADHSDKGVPVNRPWVFWLVSAEDTAIVACSIDGFLLECRNEVFKIQVTFFL